MREVLKNREDIILIDVRSKEEYALRSICDYNIPIISKEEHNELKKRLYLAIPIILRGLFKRREQIYKELLKVSEKGNKTLILCCSRGRLRSPIMCIYGRLKGVKCKVLKRGIKYYYGESKGVFDIFKL